MCRPTRPPNRGRLLRPGEMSEEYAQPLHRGTGGSMYTRKAHATRETNLDHLNQVRRDLWRYAEIGPNGEVLAADTREMALRWTYRWELHHLLNLCGLAVEAEYSDFFGSAPAYGKELILVARIA